MEKAPVTASAVMSFAQRLEDDSAAFYTALARRWPDFAEKFLGFAKACEKSKVLVVRTYQETITDALEACFCFEGLDLTSYAVDTTLGEDADLADALAAAVRLETNAIAFYHDVAELSQSLLATIPRAFSRAGKTREKRRAELQEMME